VDIIFKFDNDGNVTATFCGVNDRPYSEHIEATYTESKVFAVRFYVWGFSILSGDTLQNTKNVFMDADFFMIHYVNEVKKSISIDSSFDDFISISNRILINQIKERFVDPNFMNALYHILKSKGNIRIDTLADRCFIGKRQLERLFRIRMDLSPKQFTNLIRYQNAWRGILRSRDINELVLQLGYSDQSHLLREFKSYHGITPYEAKIFSGGMNRPVF
jgi:AraC-like DNA-binding protein